MDLNKLADLSITAKTKLAPTKDLKTKLVIDVNSQGEAIASEFKKQVPGQSYMKIDEETGEITTGDDGISQQVTIKTGVATVGNAIVPNPVTLKPYRTFVEVEQPESKFIFRMKDGPTAALFEADGGVWRNKAMHEIKKYIYENLLKGNRFPNIVIIS